MSFTIKDQEWHCHQGNNGIIIDKQYFDNKLEKVKCPVCKGSGQDDLPFDGCYMCEGYCTVNVEDAVDQWLKSDTELSVHEYLGLTIEEYSNWAKADSCD